MFLFFQISTQKYKSRFKDSRFFCFDVSGFSVCFVFFLFRFRFLFWVAESPLGALLRENRGFFFGLFFVDRSRQPQVSVEGFL